MAQRCCPTTATRIPLSNTSDLASRAANGGPSTRATGEEDGGGRSRQAPIRWVATGKLAGEVLEFVPASSAPSEVGDDAESERVADAGEEFMEQIGGSAEDAGSGGADHLDVMAFPAHWAATQRARG
jgi:hypothetical protein